MARKSKVLRTLKEMAARYDFEFVGETTKSHYRWRHRPSGRILISVSDFTSFHAEKNAEHTMRQVSNGQHSNAHG